VTDVVKLIDSPLERLVAGCLVRQPELIEHAHPQFGLDVVADFQAIAVIKAVANLRHRGDPIDRDSVAAELEHTGMADIHVWYPKLVDATPETIDAQRFVVQTGALVRVAATRVQAILDGESAARLDAEIDDIALRDVDLVPPPPAPPEPPKPQAWKRCRELVDVILARAAEPWVQLRLGGEDLVSVRPGGIVLLIGGTGRGKTSLAATLLVEHAQHSGPSIGLSLELTGDEWTARSVGTRCSTSWAGVLHGEVPRDRMIEVLPERLAIVERDVAKPLDVLRLAIRDLRAEYGEEQPILVAVDYVQLIGADDDEDIRPRVGKVMRQLDSIARSERVVMIALTQGSRVSTRQLNSGEKLGSDTTDTGAESADLERWATVTIAIGQHGPVDSDGTCAADLSVGKSRMGGGDRVIPARYHGLSGLWRTAGDARPASEVRAERAASRDSVKVTHATHAIVGLLAKSKEPMSQSDIKRALGIDGNVIGPAVKMTRDEGRVVRVRGKKKGGYWPLWTPEQAESAGVPTIPDGVTE
jgi:replicative DNA helicase